MPDLSRLCGLLLGAALLLSARGLRADGLVAAANLPERAGVPVAYVEGKRYPIVSYNVGQPVIQRDGKWWVGWFEEVRIPAS